MLLMRDIAGLPTAASHHAMLASDWKEKSLNGWVQQRCDTAAISAGWVLPSLANAQGRQEAGNRGVQSSNVISSQYIFQGNPLPFNCLMKEGKCRGSSRREIQPCEKTRGRDLHTHDKGQGFLDEAH